MNCTADSKICLQNSMNFLRPTSNFRDANSLILQDLSDNTRTATSLRITSLICIITRASPGKLRNSCGKLWTNFINPTPDGLIGNEDCGQMSAWYILSALGFYQVNPSQPIYAFGTPIFQRSENSSRKRQNFYDQSHKCFGQKYLHQIAQN